MSASYPEPEWLEEKHHADGLTYTEMSEIAGVSTSCISYHMKKHNIKGRSTSEAVAIARGNKLKNGLSEHGLEVMVGEMLGDGGLTAKSVYSAEFAARSNKKRHRDWLAKILDNEGFAIRTEHQQNEAVVGSGMRYDSYRVRTLYYPCLKNVYDAWYTGPTNSDTGGSNPSKRVPEDVEITPTVLLHWWLGDGSWCDRDKHARICAHGFTDTGRTRLINALAVEEIEATAQSSGYIYIRTTSTNRFFTYMADPPVNVKPERFP